MAGVDSEQFALNVRLQVVDVVDGLYLGLSHALEWWQLNAPFPEGFDLDVQTSTCILARHDAVDSRVGEACFGVNVGLGIVRNLFQDKVTKLIGSHDGIFAGNDGNGVV